MRVVTALTAGLLLVGLGSAVAWADGKALYEKSCASCHGASGKGDGPAAKALKTKPAELATAVKSKSEAEVAAFIKEGKPELKPPHPRTKLTDEQVQEVAKYVKGL